MGDAYFLYKRIWQCTVSYALFHRMKKITHICLGPPKLGGPRPGPTDNTALSLCVAESFDTSGTPWVWRWHDAEWGWILTVDWTTNCTDIIICISKMAYRRHLRFGVTRSSSIQSAIRENPIVESNMFQRYHHLKFPTRPKFEGHVTPNEDEYQKSVWKNLDIVLKFHNPPLVFWMVCFLFVFYLFRKNLNRLSCCFWKVPTQNPNFWHGSRYSVNCSCQSTNWPETCITTLILPISVNFKQSGVVAALYTYRNLLSPCHGGNRFTGRVCVLTVDEIRATWLGPVPHALINNPAELWHHLTCS